MSEGHTLNLTLYKEILQNLEGKTLREKNIRVAGVITDYVKKKHDIDLIVVGGLSVEFYTSGGYTTEDIDFVGPGHEEIMQCLVDLGFSRKGKDSVHERLQIYVEVPNSVLSGGDINKIQKITTEDGFIVNLIGIEDIFCDRLRAVVHWKEEYQLPWLVELYISHYDEMDFEYIESVLTPAEKEYYDKFMRMMTEQEEAYSHHEFFKQFLQKNGIIFSESADSIIWLYLKSEPIGVRLYPFQNIYFYDEDDEIVPFGDDEVGMTPDEFIAKLQYYGYESSYDMSVICNELRRIYTAE